MEIKKDYSVYELYCESWGGARDTLSTIMKYNKEDEFMDLFHEIFGETIPAITDVNDWLWFDDDFIFEILNIEENDGE